MLRPLIAFTLALILAACVGISRGDATLSLRVSGDSPGVEGSVIFLQVDYSEQQLDWANHTAPIKSGHHVVSVDMAICVGTCDNLDPAHELCRADVDLAPDGIVTIDIVGRSLAPGTSCEIGAQ